MVCPRCGTENDEKKQFCKSCGNPLASNVIDPIDFGKTQALPVIVTPIEPMSKEEELKQTSVIPVISEEVEEKASINLEEEKMRELEQTAIRENLLHDAEMNRVKENIKDIKSKKKPNTSSVITITVIVILFLICAFGITYYLYKKDVLTFVKKETTTTTTKVTIPVEVDKELKYISDEIIVNSVSHNLKFGYEIIENNGLYSPVMKIYLDNVKVGEPIIQENSYQYEDLYNEILNSEIFVIEKSVINGLDKEYYYININVNNKFYVYILNDTNVIYNNTTDMFMANDTTNIYNNKTSLLNNGAYCYLNKVDDNTAIEQIISIQNDTVNVIDGITLEGTWK